MSYGSFPEALADKVKAHPSKIFIIEGDKRVTYKQHLAAALSFSERLRELGVKRGDNVIICTSQTITCLNAFMAAYILGAVVVPIESGSPAAKIIEIQKLVGASAIVDTAPIADDCPFIDISLAAYIDDKYNNCETGELIAAMPEYPKPDDILSIMFTTGTTGKSKGVVLTVDSQMGVAENVKACLYSDESVVLIITTFSHVNGIRRYQGSLIAGGAIVLAGRTLMPKPFFDAVQHNGVNVITMTPTHVSVLLNYAEEKFKEAGTQLKILEIGSNAIPESMKEKLIHLLSETRLLSFYGCTEAGVICVADLRETANRKHCIGRPINVRDMYIGDSKGAPIGLGSKNFGHICAAGRNVMKEYYNDSELTATILENRRLITSDLGYADDEGFFYFTGRADDVIISGGYKISPHEVEEAALQVSGIADCACIPVADSVSGSVPKLFVVLEANAEFSYKAISEGLSSHLESSLLPRYIEPIEKIPRTESGKILRRDLK